MVKGASNSVLRENDRTVFCDPLMMDVKGPDGGIEP